MSHHRRSRSLLRHTALVVAVFVVGCLWCQGGTAAESDPYYPWLHPPARDATVPLNRMIQQRLDLGLSELNRWHRKHALSCRDAAARMVSTLDDTAMHYVWGGTRSWRLPTSPASRTEYDERLRPQSTYRYAPLLPAGSLVPLDPALRVGIFLFGTDKIGHFFTDGLRYFDKYLEERARGASEQEAVRAAVVLGVVEESNTLGLGVSGIFSFGDLQANDRGFRFFRELCEGPEPKLYLHHGRWVLREPFAIERFVDACWDEGWNTSAYGQREGPAILRAIQELCPRWRSPVVEARRARYRQTLCHSRSRPILAELLRAGVIPDPAPWSIDRICPPQKATSVVEPSDGLRREAIEHRSSAAGVPSQSGGASVVAKAKPDEASVQAISVVDSQAMHGP